MANMKPSYKQRKELVNISRGQTQDISTNWSKGSGKGNAPLPVSGDHSVQDYLFGEESPHICYNHY